MKLFCRRGPSLHASAAMGASTFTPIRRGVGVLRAAGRSPVDTSRREDAQRWPSICSSVVSRDALAARGPRQSPMGASKVQAYRI